MTIEAMKQALAVLEEIADEVSSPYDNKLGDAILALRAAIEQTKKPHRWQRLTEEEIARRESVNPIRVRIMQEAYDLADRDDSEGYNSVKVMCSEVLSMIDRLLDELEIEMTEDDIIRMAKEADLWLTSPERIEAVKRFAALVAAAERNRITDEEINRVEKI